MVQTDMAMKLHDHMAARANMKDDVINCINRSAVCQYSTYLHIMQCMQAVSAALLARPEINLLGGIAT